MALLLKRAASSRSFLSIRYSIHQSRSISSLNTISEASGFNHLGSELLRETTQNGKGTAEVMETAKSMMEAAINALPREPSKLRRGRATAGMLDHIIVDNGGVKLPLHRVALISIKDPKTVSVTPYDPNVIKEVESAIVSSPLGLNPQVDGQRLFAPIRPLSREHMQAICKVVTKSGEDAKRSIKIARQNALDTIHKAASKDAVGKLEKEIDELSNKFLKSAEDMCKPPVRQRERALRQFTYGQGKSAGRNSLGRITIFHRGGGAKRLQRRIDMKRSTSSMGVVEKIEYDPNRSARIALVRWIEGVQLRRQKSIQEFAPPPKFLQPTIQTQFPFSSLPGKGSYNTCTRDIFFSALSSPKAKGESPSFRLPRMAVAGAKPAFFLPLSGENNFCLSQVGKWKRHITMKRKAAVSWQSLKHRFVEAEEPKPKTNQGSLPAKTTKDDRAPFSYIIASHQMEVGKMVINTDSSEQGGSRYDSIVDTNSQIGNCMPLNNMRIGTWVHDIEANPGEGAKLVRSAGAYAKILKEPGKECVLRLPSGAEKVIDARCRATIGIVSNITHGSRKLKKAGNSRWLGKRPVVRGVAMNPVDHPHGGGEGRAKGGRPSVSPWGKPTKSGYKTGAGKRTKK